MKGNYYIYLLIEWKTDFHRKLNMVAFAQNYIEYDEEGCEKVLAEVKDLIAVRKA